MNNVFLSNKIDGLIKLYKEVSFINFYSFKYWEDVNVMQKRLYDINDLHINDAKHLLEECNMLFENLLNLKYEFTELCPCSDVACKIQYPIHKTRDNNAGYLDNLAEKFKNDL